MLNPETAYLVRKKLYIRIFRRAHAVTPEKAVVPEEYGIKRGMVFRRMERDRILLNTGNDKYYLDELREYKLRRRASIIVIVVLVVIVLTTFIVFAISALKNKPLG